MKCKHFHRKNTGDHHGSTFQPSDEVIISPAGVSITGTIILRGLWVSGKPNYWIDNVHEIACSIVILCTAPMSHMNHQILTNEP
jgi:hypothetical protein